MREKIVTLLLVFFSVHNFFSQETVGGISFQKTHSSYNEAGVHDSHLIQWNRLSLGLKSKNNSLRIEDWTGGEQQIKTLMSVNLNGNVGIGIDVAGSTRIMNSLDILADGHQGHVASKILMKSHHDYRGAGLFSVGQTNNWFIGNPYTDHANSFMIGVGSKAEGVESIAQKKYAKFYVNSNGNVGIGTTSPSEKLDLRGDMYINSGVNDNHLYWAGHNMTMGTKVGSYSHNIFHLKPGGANQGKLFSQIRMYNANSPSDHELKILLHSNGNSYFNAGNVGIGTTSPTAKIHAEIAAGNTKGAYVSKVINKSSENWSQHALYLQVEKNGGETF